MDNVSIFAPGRVELLGNHTDYNEGLVLSAALPLGITISGKLREDQIIRLTTTLPLSKKKHGFFQDEVKEITIERSLEQLQPEGHWSDYAAGVFSMLRQQGIVLGGVEATFSSTLPIGAGLSSSAALEVATALFLQQLFGFQMTKLELAQLCRRAENEFVGVKCGLLDQVSSLFGCRSHALLFDARSEEIKAILVPQNIRLLIIHSGVPRVLVQGEYNKRREECLAAAQALGIRALRDISMQELQQNGSSLNDILMRRALHVVGENERVQRVVQLLAQQEMKEIGTLLYESHESSRVYFENSTPMLDALVSIAKTTEGVYGARLTGGGFGGAIIALVDQEHAQSAGETISAIYQQKTGHHASFLVGECSEGAVILA